MDLRLLLFLALLLLVFHFLPFSTSSCPQYFDCGNLGNISFPFFNSSHPTDCGLCMINCDDKSSPKVALGIPQDKWFEAEIIDISNSIMRIHDPVLQQHLDNRSCEYFNFDLSFSKSPFISYTILQNITLFKCKFSLIPETRKKISDLFSGYDNYDLCNNLGYTIYYQNPKYHVPGPAVPFYETSQLQCTTLNLPMVSKYNDSVKPGFFELLTAEFDLQWNLSDDCNRSNCYSEGHICRTNWLEDSRCAKAEKGKKNLKVILATATSIGGFVILVTIAFCFWRRFPFMEIWMKPKKFQNIEAFLKNYGSIAPKRYYYSEVKKMTNSFKIKLGQGGYGCVYKGNLQDGSSIAVKVLKESKGSGEEFINEVASISRTSHVNIVTLIGFCFEGHKRALLYEFMPNGSLEKFTCGGNGISSSTDHQLGWQRKYKIAVGIARGLEYLHRGCNTRIVHFDIKPHNILLDEDFCPKISDFGLAKLCPSKQSTMSILGARGTAGYIAPEVFCKAFGGVSYKSDVYSYGMMVFEMVGVRRRNVNAGVDHSSEMYFPDWIYKRLDQVDDDLSVDGLIMDEEEEVLRRKMIIVSLWCIQTHPSSRPSMTKVVEMLEGSLEALQIPSNPCIFPPQEPPKDSSIADLTWHSDSNNVALVVS